MTTTPTSGAAIQRYKIGYHADEWGQRSSTPSGIPDASGSWVRYEDHIAELRSQHARIAELEAQLSAIGAGGVEAPAAPVSTYVEVRECSDCGHVGINDTDGSKAACNTCDWQGDSPREDKCPGCNRVGTMSAACPKCGSRTLLLAETHLLAAAPQAVQAAVPVGGQSRFKGEKDWQWCSAEHVAMVLATPWSGRTTRFAMCTCTPQRECLCRLWNWK